MLRSRSLRALPASRHSQRLIWSRASDFVEWLGLGTKTSPETLPSPSQQQPKVETAKPSSRPPKRHAVKPIPRPQLPTDAVLPVLKQPFDLNERQTAAHALGRFSEKIRNAESPQHVLDAWDVISQCRPFVVAQDEPLQVSLATEEVMGSDLSQLMQVVPANVFAQHSTSISTRVMYVGSVGSELDTDVVVVNEALVVGNMIKALNRMDEHKLTVAFFEAYDIDRKTWLQQHQLQETATVLDDDVKAEEVISRLEEKKAGIDTVTQLPIAVYACYLRSLFDQKQSTKIVRLFRDDEHQLERVCSVIPNLYLLLQACYQEMDGNLARRAIERITERSPTSVIPLGCYDIAFRSILRDRQRDESDLLDAIYLAKTMNEDAGYILKPWLWGALVKVSLIMNRPDLALQIFKEYPRNCIPEHQKSFRQVLRAACKHPESTALDMMHFCWAGYNDEYSNAKTLLDERRAYQDAIYLTKSGTEGLSLGDAVLVSSAPALSKDAETELLNMMLWEMLKHRHAVPSLVQVLDLMEAVGSKGGALALRKTVFALFEYDVKQKKKSPREAVENSVNFWGEHSSVLNGQGFLVHLLLEECVKHHWDDACDVLVDYLLDGGVSRLPVNSIVKMMGTNEVRGRFEANASLGKKLLEKLSRKNIAKLRDDFYERYLMSYLRLERFDDVGQQYTKLKLKKRYPHNEVIRTIVQDAAAQLVDTDVKPGVDATP
ncbi:hypothetical protein P3T76_011036 [Phytophthora citrophthora]|uniref:Uncharacterized protein n=1 Tax=Phytophthora citrophthora TaxID=4793 RepID=A0AAD9G9U2_9STRA|nr:hypothetical protein P3T76_011036 [Phytophthora citrophthora]